MDSDDGCSVGTASTDTSMLLRELGLQVQAQQALNNMNPDGTSDQVSQCSTVETMKGLATGEDENPETLSQALQTLRGDQPSQIVDFSEDTEESSFGIYSRKVEVYVSPADSLRENASGSNKVRVTPVVNHVWEHKYVHGNLVAVHKDSDFMAYVLKGKSGANCRVVSRKTAARNLLRGFNGNIMDIAFAISDDINLAIADDSGTLYVHSFTSEGDNILPHLILQVERETYSIESAFRSYTRVIWCPYMPDEDTDGGVDVAKTLVLLHGTQAEVWNVELVSNRHGTNPDVVKCIGSGMMRIEPNETLMPVINAAFAPDGSAIAVAYYSGEVKFYLVDIDSVTDAGCMHEWSPHDGNPVTSLFFLDDHRHTSPDQQLWKFALTGANFNTEIKIWSCESWACVQVLRFNAPMSQPDLNIQLKSEIDLSSKYLVLSDIQSKILYILHLHQDTQLATAHISSLSNFYLTLPCVSFAIYDACIKKLKRSTGDSHLDEITTGELEENGEVMENGDTQGSEGLEKSTMGVQIKICGIHTKCLQELLIRYRPESSAPPPSAPSVSSMSQDETGIRDMLSDVSFDQSLTTIDISNIPNDPTHYPHGAMGQSITSSGAQSFAEPARDSSANHVEEIDESPADPSNLQSAGSSTSSFTFVTAMNEDIIDSPLSSVDPSSIMSPSSAYSQTPQKNANHSSNILPPITSGDDDDDGADDDDDGEGRSTAKNSVCSEGRRSGTDFKEDEVEVEESLHKSLEDEANLSNQDVLDDMFTGSSWQNKGPEPSSSTESTGSIVKRHHERYDEDDQEVAQALSSTLVSEGFGGPQQEEEEEETNADVGEEEDEEDEEEEKTTSGETSMEVNKKGAKWPHPPDVSQEAKRLVTEAIQQSTVEEKFDDENDEAEIEEILEGDKAYAEISQCTVQDTVSFVNVENKLSDLADKMMHQQELLLLMQRELSSQREVQIQLHRQQMEQQQLQHVASQQPSIQEDISKLEDILVSRMEHSLAQHMHKETQRLQDSLAKSDQQRLVRDKALQTALVTEVGQSIRESVSNTLKTEIKQTVSPALHRFVEPMKDKIHQEVAQRLTACDTLLKDNIAKAVKSRSTMDVLANSVGDVIYQQMQQAYTHTFKASMLPSFSATMEKTVRDVHGVFQQGTKEYQHYLKQSSDSVMKERARTEEIIQRMEGAEQQFAQGMNHMKNLIITSVKDELNGQVAQAVSNFKVDMLSDIHRMVKEEIGLAMKDHGASIDDKLTTYLRSAAATPVPGGHEDDAVVNKEKIIRDLRSGHVDEAFQSALSAENLDLVLYACEAVSPMNLFAVYPCPLSQPVLLSLISQLAANLDQHFELKMKFLSDAVMSLDTDNSRTADHIPPVLGALVRCLNAAVKSFSSDPRKVKEIKMLIMAANSLVVA